jgi:uncharacterized protein YaaQ
MKMIIAIIRDIDDDTVTHALTGAEFRVTRIASTGGFLRRGNNTLLIGLDDEKVEQAMQIIRDSCSPSPDPEIRRATIFVLNVSQYTHF